MSAQSPQWIATARLLRRMGFGASGAQIDAATALGPSTYIDRALAADADRDVGAAATPMPQLAPPAARPGRGATVAARRRYNQQLNQQMSELSDWWIRRMAAVQQPVHEKLTLLWHNHFATSARKVRVATWMAAQNQKLRTLKLGDFHALSYAMLTDAAMLRWLDGQLNTARAANENLAREFMELFALGHGNGYTEADVRNGARALTGWAIHPDGQAAMMPNRHDSGTKTVLGVTADLDAAGFCKAVLSEPNSARFVAGRLWQQLASDAPPPDATLDRLLSAYGPSRHLTALTKAVLTDAEFTANPAAVVNTPVEWLLGVIRTLQVPVGAPDRLKAIHAALNVLGQQPFYPPDVGGWPRGQAWLSTASADVRMQTANRLAHAGDLSTVEQAAPADRIDAVGYLIGVGVWSPRTVTALKPLVRAPAELVAVAVNTPEYLTS